MDNNKQDEYKFQIVIFFVITAIVLLFDLSVLLLIKYLK
jgi:hypothetical protein